jgi:hypothetical protein
MNLGFAAMFLLGVRLDGLGFAPFILLMDWAWMGLVCHLFILGLLSPCFSSFSSHFPPQLGLFWALFFSPFLFFFSLLLSWASSSSFSYLWMGLFWPSSSLLISFLFSSFPPRLGHLYPLPPLLLVLGFGGFLGLSSPPSFVAVQFDIVGPVWASPLPHHLWLFGMELLGLVWASSLIHWLLFGFYPCRYLSKHK